MNSPSILNNSQFEVHDKGILANARSLLDKAGTRAQMLDEVLAAVKRNEE